MVTLPYQFVSETDESDHYFKKLNFTVIGFLDPVSMWAEAFPAAPSPPQRNSQMPAGCPTLQLNSDTVFLEIA